MTVRVKNNVCGISLKNTKAFINKTIKIRSEIGMNKNHLKRSDNLKSRQ